MNGRFPVCLRRETSKGNVLTGAWQRKVGEISLITGDVPPCPLGYFTEGFSAIETYITLTNAHQSW